jgi:hypothetical protein
MNQKKLSHLSDLYKLTFHNNIILIVLFLSFLHLQKVHNFKRNILKEIDISRPEVSLKPSLFILFIIKYEISFIKKEK